MNSFNKSVASALIALSFISNLLATELIKQPTVPKNYKLLPFIEKNPVPKLTSIEKQRGYMLFNRPIMDPVYPNTRPLESERLNELSAFATKGEFEPMTFTVYPLRALKNFRVKVSALKSANATIKSSAIDIRLASYWNIKYPRYSSQSTYRRQSELLEQVKSHSSPAYECQRWWLTVRVPKNATPGVYKGKVTLVDDISNKAVVIPVKFRVLDFKLLSDPNKHYSVYYYMKNRLQYTGKSKTDTRKMLDNEYQAMRDMGLNMIPTMQLDWDSKNQKISLRYADEMLKMMKLGLKGPIPVTAGGVIRYFYEKTTPGGKVRSHWDITKMPPPGCCKLIKQAFKNFVKECKDKNWPVFYCCPVDEVAANRKEFGIKVYQAVKEAGMKTYITKNPVAGDAADYANYVDAWCSQPYSMPYNKIVKQKKYEYWCYPNHNAGEIKNRVIMSKGGRMTYGYGFWRSGFKTLIPWHWSWVLKPGQFDYLRSWRAGCGQRIAAGKVIPTTYWMCFREGIDDNRYIYTLQQAVWERENSTNPKCRKLLIQAKALLQKLWNDINVQEKYLNTDMWPSEEFNARRWQMAEYTSKLLKYSPSRKEQAPSVIIDTKIRAVHIQSVMEREIKRGNIEIKDLSSSFSQWKDQTPEGKTTVTEAAGLTGKNGLRWTINMNYSGGEKNYPIGWPRIKCNYTNPTLDFTRYDYLKYMIKVDSDRNEVDDDFTKLGFTIKSNKFFEVLKDMGGRQRVWLPIIFNINDIIATTGQGSEPWRKINLLQLFINERDYKDKTKMIFDIGSVQLLRFKTPVIAKLTTPEIVLLPTKEIALEFELLGNIGNKKYKIIAELQTANGRTVNSLSTKLNAGRIIILNTENLTPEKYQLILSLSGKGKVCSRFSKTINFTSGPFSNMK